MKCKEVFVNFHSFLLQCDFCTTCTQLVFLYKCSSNYHLQIPSQNVFSFTWLMMRVFSWTSWGFDTPIFLCLWAQDTRSDLWKITIFVNVDQIIEVHPGSSTMTLAVLMYSLNSLSKKSIILSFGGGFLKQNKLLNSSQFRKVAT